MLKLRKNVSLAPLTTFRIGGKASFYIKLSCPLVLAEAVEYAEEHGLRVCILGGGSNVLFADHGFQGLVIHLSGGGIKVTDSHMSIAAGADLADVVNAAADHSLAGLEKIAGIPGSFGGAIRGNAGAFGTEIGDLVTKVKAMDRRTGMIREYRKEDCHFKYRDSRFKGDPDLIILSAELRLAPGAKKSDLARIMKETMAKREAKHPQKAKCAGSFFMNPIVHDQALHEEFERDTGLVSRDHKLPAGWLIDHAGLRGKRIGGAMVSERHPNYLLNTGHATAEDVITLASLVKTRVRDEFGVRLREEVQFVGF